MFQTKLHLHSMLVHAVAALVPLASLTWIAETNDLSVGGFGPPLWTFLTRLALAIVLVVCIPATISGIGERNHMYATWHRTHKIKLVLSVVLTAMVALEIWFLAFSNVRWPVLSWFGFMMVLANNVVTFALGSYGLKITLGRQGFGRTAYTPDMYKDPPVDILEAGASYVLEQAKTIEPNIESREGS